MVLLDTPTETDVAVPVLVIMTVILFLGVLGWWLGASSGKGTRQR